MSSDIVQKFPTLGECNRYTNGMCSTRSCLIRGGWKQGDAVDYDLATCETRDIRKTIEALEAEVARLNAECCRCGQPTTAVCKAARDAEARAERLRVALEAINKGNEQTTYMHLGTALAIARKALEDDKQ